MLAIGFARAALIEGVAPSSKARIAAAEGALRACVGDEAITIALRPSGRPRLLPPYPELGISLSHRSDLVLAGFTPSGAAGVDIEIGAPALEPERLAADHYNSAEAAAVQTLPAAAARDLFLRFWVAKEAALKVTGRGIHDGLVEPGLSAYAAELSTDGTILSLAPSTRLPALRLAVRRLELPGRSPFYCALAIAEP